MYFISRIKYNFTIISLFILLICSSMLPLFAYGDANIKIGSKVTKYSFVIYGDYDGDKKKEKAIWDNNNGIWKINCYYNTPIKKIKWGQSGDIPFSGDFDKDKIDEIAVYRPSTRKCYISMNNESWPSKYEYIVNNCKKYLNQ